MDTTFEDISLRGMKRKFEQDVASASRKEHLGNTTLRHRLLNDFEELEGKDGGDHTGSMSGLADQSYSQRQSSFSLSGTQQDSPIQSSMGRQMRLKDAEILDLKASLTKFQNQITSLKREGQQALIQHDNKIAEYKMATEREINKATELKSKVQFVMEREKTARERVDKLEKELQQQLTENNQKLYNERKLRLDAVEKAEQEKYQWKEIEEKLQKKIMSQKHTIADLQYKNEEHFAQLVLKKNHSDLESQKLIDQLTESLQEEKKKVQELEARFAQHEDNLVATKALKADLEMVPSMKIELEKLRQDNEKLSLNEQNAFLLEEKIRGLKQRAEQVDALMEKNVALQVENEELNGRLSRWEMLDTSGSRRPQSPSSLTRRATEMERVNASLMMNQGEMETKVKLSERKLEQAESEKQSLAAQLSAEKNTTFQLNDSIKRLKRKVLLLSKEVDVFKGLLASYESEVTISIDMEKSSQIQQLESLVHQYKEVTAHSEEKIESLSDQLAQTLANFDQVQQQLQISQKPGDQSSPEDKEMLAQLREQNAVLESQLLKTEEEKNDLEVKIEQRHLQGDYNPAHTKIIHFLENPHAIAARARQEEVSRLTKDNEKLRKRNQILEENGGEPVGELTVQVEERLQERPTKEIEDLKSQLASSEMRNQRLKEIFGKTSKDFREVCYQLTGYRFDIPRANQYRLTSMYAERSKDHLLFQQNAQGEVQLLQTDFSMAFKDAMEHDLQKCKSLPLFLSHITIELFSRQTMSFE